MSDQDLCAHIPELAGIEAPLFVGSDRAFIDCRIYFRGAFLELAKVLVVKREDGWDITMTGPRLEYRRAIHRDHPELGPHDDRWTTDLRKPLQQIRAGHLLVRINPLGAILGSDLLGYLKRAI